MNRIMILLFFLLGVSVYSSELQPGQSSGPAAVPEKKSPVKYTPAPEMHYKLLPLSTIDYETVNQYCRPMLSAGGLMNYEQKRNSILVYDTNEVIAKIDKFLRDIDREAVNIRIDVDFMNTGSAEKDKFRVDTDYGKGKKGNQIVIKDGKVQSPKEITVNADKSRERTTNNTSQFIMTKSGFPASLWVGKTIVDPNWLNNIRSFLNPVIIVNADGTVLKMDGFPTDFKWVDVGASMKVLPLYRDDGLIDVEIYPEVSFIDGKGKKQAVKVEQLITRLTVADGQRIYVGGVLSGKQNTYNSLFGPDFFKRNDSSNALDMYLTARAIKPDGSNVKKQKTDGGRDYSDPRNIFKR